MKVYRWEETEQHWIAVIRPDPLFDLSTRSPKDFPEEYKEGMQLALHVVSGVMEPFAYVWNKRFGKTFQDRKLVEARMSDRPERYLESDRKHLSIIE